MKICIGLVGEPGSGKGSFVEIMASLIPHLSCFSSSVVGHHRSSDILVETLDAWSLPATRENLQKLAIAFDGSFGKGTLSNAVKQRILADSNEIVVFDGIRWLTDVDMLRHLPNNILVYVTAPAEVRFERMKARKEKSDEGGMSFDQFLREGKADTEIYIPIIGEHADHVVHNNIQDPNKVCLTSQVKIFIFSKIRPLLEAGE
jgi:dephospho-CoA kinase